MEWDASSSTVWTSRTTRCRARVRQVWDDAGMTPVDPVLLVTGATGPVGRAAAAAFAMDGARLGLSGTDAGRLTAMAADLRLADEAWAPAVGDLRDADVAAAAIGLVTERFGRIDGLLHLVGGWAGGTALVDLDPAELASMLDRHVWSTFHAARAVVPGMVERGWGRIVAITSSTVARPGPRAAAYVAAKAGQEALLRTLAREAAGTGVTVNLLVVNTVDTDHLRETDPSPKHGRWTTPEEVVDAIRFLWSDAGAAVNGALLPLDGRG